MKPEFFNKGARIPCLDGVRALAISIVIVAHASGTVTFVARKQIYYYTGDLGPLGVNLFFVLSGFLITTVLFHDLEERGRPDLRRFYIRRAFRILPAYFSYIIVMYILQMAGAIKIPFLEWFGALTYTIDYLPRRSWYLMHCWSLAVEEQFYLLWPTAIWLWGKRGALFGALCVILVVPWIRLTTVLLFPFHRGEIPWEFHTVCDALAIGCALAGFRNRLASIRVYEALRAPIFGLAAIGGAFFFTLLSYHIAPLRLTLGGTVVSICWAWLLDVAMTNHRSRLGRPLNWPPIVYLGMISYSLYLWQQPFLQKADHPAFAFPMNLCYAIGAAILSYHLIERPFLRLRRRREAKRDGQERRGMAPPVIAAHG